MADSWDLRRRDSDGRQEQKRSSSPWTFHTADPELLRQPQLSRQESLPRDSLFNGSGSLFGSGNVTHHDTYMERPSLSLRPPSDEATLEASPELGSNVATLPFVSSRYGEEIRSAVDRRRIPRAEKETDDPSESSTSAALDSQQHGSTSATLSRLFAAQGVVSPEGSRASSYIQPMRREYARQLYNGETTALPDHLYSRGLLAGRHSDIIVVAFGKEYKLHRLVLDRAPFFATALSEPWLEANAKSMTVRPEDIDTSITQHAFELALKRLYGCPNVHEEDAHAVGLFATGCWLEMVDLIDSSLESMLRQMVPETLASLINLVTRNYYGRAGGKILASAKAMLCRDGWQMPIRYWDGIPSDIVREIIGGDGFFIDGEWDRWILAKRILDRRLRARAIEAELLEPGTRHKVAKAPAALGLMAVRFDSVSRRSTPAAFSQGMPDSFARYISLYTHPTIEPLLVLLDEGIHYIHLGFEQLQYIRQARDVIGLPVMPEKVVSSALWQQMELRQRVMNAREADLELGLAMEATEDQSALERTMSTTDTTAPAESKGKHRIDDSHPDTAIRDFGEAEDDYDSQSWDGTGRPRKFWIPSSDCNIVMGGTIDPIIAISNQRHAARMSATLQPEDVTWASDFATSTTTAQPRPTSSDSTAETPPPAVSYTHIPPFRFSAEFPAPRLLKERKRVYSRTVFYAGSLWNIYIQKVSTARHTKQLGVYLHRAKERETEEAVYGSNNHVETRIGRLERDLRRHRRGTLTGDEDGDDDSGSAGDIEGHPEFLTTPSQRRHNRRSRTTSADPLIFPSLASSDSDSDTDSASRLPLQGTSAPATLPPYVDARPQIKTYFKIYSPSRNGRMLSVYESAPDRFNFSQSWGWKSSTLMLDEGMLEEGESVQVGLLDGKVVGDGDGREEGRGSEGRLRFMVVVGNI